MITVSNCQRRNCYLKLYTKSVKSERFKRLNFLIQRKWAIQNQRIMNDRLTSVLQRNPIKESSHSRSCIFTHDSLSSKFTICDHGTTHHSRIFEMLSILNIFHLKWSLKYGIIALTFYRIEPLRSPSYIIKD